MKLRKLLTFNVLPRHVYLHVPFCARRCSYCDFSIAVRRVVPVGDYLEGIERELALRFPERERWPVETVYLGGGTPSRLGADGITGLLGTLRERLAWGDEAEVTIEANPDDVDESAARAWKAAGVNRLSIGAQSFDARVLRWMHRTHDESQIARALERARAAGIDNISVDLIFAIPDGLERDWRRDLDLALALEPTHVSLYGLTVEPGTPLGRWRDRGVVAEAPEERYEREFLEADRMLTAAGFEHYEVSNYALPARRARHNSSYWRHVPYVGLGPSAHSFDGGTRRWNIAPYAEWLEAVRQGRDPVEGQEVLSAEEREAERIYLGLRTVEGLALDPSREARVRPWVEAGWAAHAGGRLRLSAAGWLRLDALAADLTTVGSRY
jgi:oxygen-independent coproporphyrinogen III oxidase